MKSTFLQRREQQWLLAGLALTIPAFYLVLGGASPAYRGAGQALYLLSAVLQGLRLRGLTRGGRPPMRRRWLAVDTVLLLTAALCATPAAPPWNALEWLLRLGCCALVALRLVSLASRYLAPNRLLLLSAFALATLGLAGAGFYWLEPQVHSYGDGLWLAFTTGATVGYGDLVPTTPASRIFACFMVLLGYAMLSIVTASIAALLVGEDEKILRREMHADMRLLRNEIVHLRAEMAALRAARNDTPES